MKKSKKQILDEYIDKRVNSTLKEQNIFGIQQASRGNVSFHIPGKVDSLLGEVYQQLVTMKLEFDSMEEIPNSFMPIYNQINKAMSQVSITKQETTQLAGMTRKITNR